MKIPLLKPNPPPISEWSKYLEMSYQTATFSNNGPCVALLESRLQEYLGLSHKPVLMSNATAALTLVLQALQIQNQDVLIPTFTFAATAQSVLQSGNRPKFVDIDTFDWHMSTKSARQHLPATTMVVVQSLGFTCHYPKYVDFAEKYGLNLIFDSAACLGAKYSDGLMAGVAGDCEIFSLHITKTFGVGEGALVTSHNPALLDYLRRMTNFGFDSNNQATILGTNCKMSDFHAAVGLSVLDHIDEKLESKKKAVEHYIGMMSKYNAPITFNPGREQAYQVMPVLFTDQRSRDAAHAALSKADIGSRIYYTPLHRHPLFLNKKPEPFWATDSIADRILCLPLFETITEQQIEHVVETICMAL